MSFIYSLCLFCLSPSCPPISGLCFPVGSLFMCSWREVIYVSAVALWQFSFSFPVYVVVGKASLLHILQWIHTLSFSHFLTQLENQYGSMSIFSLVHSVCRMSTSLSWIMQVLKCTVSLSRNVLFLYSHSSLDMAFSHWVHIWFLGSVNLTEHWQARAADHQSLRDYCPKEQGTPLKGLFCSSRKQYAEYPLALRG